MKKICIILVCCLTGCVADSGSNYNDSYNAYANNPYGQPVQYSAQPEVYYSQPMEYAQPGEYYQPMVYETQPVPYSAQPMEYAAPQMAQPVTYPEPMPEAMQALPEDPYEVGPYNTMYPASYNTAASPTADSHTNHYPPALPRSRPYRRPIQ